MLHFHAAPPARHLLLSTGLLKRHLSQLVQFSVFLQREQTVDTKRALLTALQRDG
jgi:hypothetical protein